MALKSYEYRAICDVCRDKRYNYELRLRWDGLMVCNQCWEVRHPLDFYRGRSDAHQLPWTRSDTEAETSYTGGSLTTAFSYTLAQGENSSEGVEGSYVVHAASDNLETSGKTVGRFTLIRYVDLATGYQIIAEPRSVSTSTGTSFTTPTTPTVAGTARFFTSLGVTLGTSVIAAASSTVTIPNWTNKPGHVYVSFSYGT